jgi:hypothetical protein
VPSESLDELIAAIRARGEPIDYESLLNWPTPPTDVEGFKIARSAFDAYNDAERKLDQDHGFPWRRDPVRKNRIREDINAITEENNTLGVDYENMPIEVLDKKLDALINEIETERERRKNDPFWKQFEREPVPRIPFLDDKPEIERVLSAEDWRLVADHLARFQTTLDKLLLVPFGVDWRPGIKPESYFDDASEYHEANYPARLLCLTAIRHALRLGQDDWDKYLTSAAHLGAGASSLRLLMSQLVYFAGVQRIVDTTMYILHHSAVVPETLRRLASTIALLDDENMLERMYVGERVFGLSQYRDKLPQEKREGDWWNRIKREKKMSNVQYYLSNMARLIEIARMPLNERFSSWLVFIQEPDEKPKSEDTDIAIIDVARPALPFNLIMLTRMRLMGAALTVLCDGPGLTTNDNLLPQDPFDPGGGPIRHRKIGDGFVVYSAGLDQVDSGGSGELMDAFGPLRGMMPRDLLTKDIVLTVTPRQNGSVSLVWS